MKTAICTTTINAPTEAMEKFMGIAGEKGWAVFVAGDLKTPKAEWAPYERLIAGMHYLSPDWQTARDKGLSALIGFNCIQRRNFAILAALDWGAERIALVDDDNIPLKGWGDNVIVGQQAAIEVREPEGPVFDPLYGHAYWHRGFPIQLLDKRRTRRLSDQTRAVRVQADLWMGTPDVDAIGHIAFSPWIEKGDSESVSWMRDGQGFYGSNRPSPFNSQNTWLHRSVFPTYFLFPDIGRMDDIFAAYALQHAYPGCVAYGPQSVEQQRNPHDFVQDLKAELIGYEHALGAARSAAYLTKVLPKRALAAWDHWREILA